MSQGPDEEATIPLALPALAAPAAPAPPVDPEPPLASGAPYRAPAPPAPDPENYSFAAPRKTRPLLGPALSVLGVLLWAFVVFGQFTTSWMFGAPLGQGTAVVAVVSLTLVALAFAVRRSRDAVATRTTARLVARSVGIAVLAFLFFVGCVMSATAAGGVMSRGHDFLIAFGLVVVSLAAAIFGPRLTSSAPLPRTHRQRSLLVGMWLAGVLLTLVAGADLAANG